MMNSSWGQQLIGLGNMLVWDHNHIGAWKVESITYGREYLGEINVCKFNKVYLSIKVGLSHRVE